MATSGVRGHGERLLLSANEVGTWGSVSPSLWGGTSRRGVARLNGCQVTPVPSSLISEAGRDRASVPCGEENKRPQKLLSPSLAPHCHSGVHMQMNNRSNTSPRDGAARTFASSGRLMDSPYDANTVCVALLLEAAGDLCRLV